MFLDINLPGKDGKFQGSGDATGIKCFSLSRHSWSSLRECLANVPPMPSGMQIMDAVD